MATPKRPHAEVRCGDALTLLRTEPAAAYDVVLTSPPYYRLRSYLPAGHPDKAQEHGQEPSVQEYVAGLAAVFREARRVLKPSGTLWIVLGDSYSVGGSGGVGRSGRLRGPGHRGGDRTSPYFVGWAAGPRIDHRERGFASKTLLGVPWRLALAMIDDGWRLRNDVIWAKPNAVPSSAADRLKCAHEHVFFFSASARYYSNLDAIKTPLKESSLRSLRQSPSTDRGIGILPRVGGNRASLYGAPTYSGKVVSVRGDAAMPLYGANPGDVWSIATQPSREHHFAGFPARLCERILRFACPPGGTVLDPFCGSGTALLAALRLGCSAVGFDLAAEYVEITRRRIAPLLGRPVPLSLLDQATGD